MSWPLWTMASSTARVRYQIHFKLYAAADQGGRHCTDLKKLNPTREELLAAAHWTFTQDVSDAFRHGVVEVLHSLGYGDLHERL